MALVGFFLLTFAVTWTAWLAPTAWGLRGTSVWFGLGGPVFLLGVFAPAVVAVALTLYSEGRVGAARLLARIGTWQVGAHLYVFAIGYMAATKLVAALIHRVAIGAWPSLGDTPVPVMLVAILFSTWVQAGEEVGWRGYALPRLATHLGLGGASIVLGVIWAFWHLPLFFLEGSGSDTQSFPIYVLHVTALSVAMSWLYWKTEGSLLLVMLMHAAVNNTAGIVPAAAAHAVDPMSFDGTVVAWGAAGVSAVVAVWLLVRMRGAELGAILGPPTWAAAASAAAAGTACRAARG